MCAAAARLTDPIAHTSLLANLVKMGGALIVGALVGAALSLAVEAAVVATVASGGLAAPAVIAIGFAINVAMEASGLNEFIDTGISKLVDALIPPSIEGKIDSGSRTVGINSLPAARAAAPGMLDIIVCAKHSSGPPPMLAQGSDNVFIENHPAARQGDMTTCGGTIAAGSGDVTIGGGTLTVREIKDERPWWLAALGLAIGTALALCGRGKMNLSALKSALPCLALNFASAIGGSIVGHAIRTAIGNPVNVITGGKILRAETDFSLPGPLALEWGRSYSSHDGRAGGLLGRGWSVAFEVELTLERDGAGKLLALHYCDDQGRRISFPPVLPGASHFSTAEGYYLICTQPGQYLVESVDGIYRDFGLPDDDFEGTLKLQRLEDRNGNWLALRYDEDGALQQLNDGCGRRIDMVYDSSFPARLAEVRLSKGADGEPPETLVQYRYTARGELAEVIDRSGQSVRRFAYQHGLMVEHSVPGGLRCHYQWKGQGVEARVIKHWTDDGESYEFDYDLAQGHTRVTDQIGRLYQWKWNADCQPTEHTDPEGHVWRYDWDENRQLVALTDPSGAVTRCEYDAAGRLTTTINALGQIERTEWHDLLDLPTAEIDAAGNRWAYEYDQRGNLILATDPEGYVTEQAYDSRGLPHTICDARGGYSHLEWSERAQLTGHTDCSGKRTGFAYDARGALARVTDAIGNSTLYRSDAQGRVTDVVRADGSVQQFRYDTLGHLNASIDPAKRETQYQRNPRGQLVRRIDAMGHSVQFVYDRAHRLERLVNENGEAYRFVYDRNDHVIEEVGLDGVSKRIEHDARGMATAVTDAAGDDDALTLRMQRDALGRLTAKHARGSSTAYRYDQVGQLLHAQQYSDQGARRTVHDTLEFCYSKRGELLSETGHLGALSHQYDALGNRSATTLPDGRTINTLYYGSGHLHQINIDGQIITDIERDDLHREVTRSQGQLTTSFGYDALGRKSWQQASSQLQHEPVLRKEWLYDHAGEVKQKRHSRHGVTNYLYDPLGRIVSTVSSAQRELFNWDAAANLVDSMQRAGYVRHNRLLMFEDKRFEYDVHGRLETKFIGPHTEQRFRYDGEHRLRAVETTRQGMRQHVQFDYDALGRRIRKTDVFGTTCFLWDGVQMMQEERGSDVATFLYEPASYMPLARVDSRCVGTPGKANSTPDEFADSTNVYYFHNDVSGIPDELTCPAGRIVWQAQYKTWGNSIAELWEPVATDCAGQQSDQSAAQNLRFQGQYLDRETGLHYNTFRFYDPDIGRFVSPDPIGLNGGNNLFQYAPNPISWFDPWGWTAQGDYGKMKTIDGYQKHHNIPQTFADHPAITASGYDVNNSKNITRLPKSAATDPGRTVHNGKHLEVYDDMVRERLDAIHKTQATPQIKKMHIDALSDDLGERLRAKKIKLNSAC